MRLRSSANIDKKTATSCLFSAFSADLINFDAASIDELDSLYDGEYEHSGLVIRMSLGCPNTFMKI